MECEKQCASSKITTIESDLLQRIRDVQSQDEQCVRVLSGKQDESDKSIGFGISKNEIVVVKNRYLFPQISIYAMSC